MEKQIKAEIWRQRVEEWRASGVTADEYGSTRGFHGGLLRHWASRLGMTIRRRRTGRPAGELGEKVQLARVVRVPGIERKSGAGSDGGGLVEVAVGRVRVGVQPGFDRATLAAVLDVIEGRLGEGRVGR
jgi:transposase